ncbi:DUF47 domain-containing protein [uncultured Adlercreutzia sp.]|uniref:DUF47 domain-containing protein n=1 Tax=uncultured Adlercreutzia sp. TaxID=875803 RepID=UPI0025E2BFC6|nr:DUF47 family protein [uncultured Adlercreutzia sp.]
MAKKKKYDYFDAYEQLSDLAVQEASVLIRAMENFTDAASLKAVLEEAHEIEHAGDMINHEIYKHVGGDFMPPIDREDVVLLAQHLDNILDEIEDVLQYLYMFDVHQIPEDALRFATIIKKSCKAVDAAMEDFRNFKKSKTFKQLVIDVSDYEEQGDVLYMEVIRNLHVNHADEPMHVLKWSRLYAFMESCCDACEHTADLMSTILLKNM